MSEELKLDEDDLGTILAIGNNEQSGRVTNFELKELVRVYRQYSAAQARLSEAVKVLEEASEHIETLSELLKVIKEDWIDYDHVFSIAVHEADKWIEEKAKPLLANE